MRMGVPAGADERAGESAGEGEEARAISGTQTEDVVGEGSVGDGAEAGVGADGCAGGCPGAGVGARAVSATGVDSVAEVLEPEAG